ncbi:NUDIX domain-containing protein [Candidatus Azambacteria bacterium]|nr:NUDIX domain-containing protein [Candidatus Azambacteria bacterium]
MIEQKTHLGIYGVIQSDNNILLIKKSRGPYKGKFDLPGGKLEHGEGLCDGLAREINEETGLTAKDFKLYDNYSVTVDFNDGKKEISMYHVGLIYLVIVASIDDIKETTDEEDSLGSFWHTIANLDVEQLSPFAKMAVKTIRNEPQK